MSGCVTLASLEVNDAVLTWVVPGHAQIGAFHDLTDGCEATIAIPHTYLTEIETPDQTLVSLNPAGLGEKCGRYQFDVELIGPGRPMICNHWWWIRK